MALARPVLRLASSAAVLTALVAGSARTRADETPPQLHPVGASVELSVLGAQITLPDAPAGWALSRRFDSNTSYDVLRRQDPTNPQLEVRFNRPTSAGCGAIATAFEKLGLKRRDPSPLAPSSWESWAFELPSSDGRSDQKLCTNTPQGPVLATVVYDGPVTALEPSIARPLLEEVGVAIGGRRGEIATTSGAAIADASGLTTLPITGLKVLVPSGWSVRDLTLDSGKKVDLVVRNVPKDPELMLSVNRLSGSCKLPEMSGTYQVTNPPWLPSGFKPQARVKAQGPITAGIMCADLGGSEFALVVVTYAGSLTHPDVLAARSILGPIGDPQSSSTASPATIDEPVSVGGDDVEEKAKPGRLELSGLHFTPPNDADPLLGGWASIGVLRTSNAGSVFGFGVELDLGLGYGAKKLFPWDVKLGGGPSILVGPVMLMPLFGIGADGINSDEVFKMKGAAYYYYGGRSSVRFSPRFGLEGFVSIHRRAGEARVGDVPLDQELRWGANALFRGWGLGLKVTEYGAEAVARTIAAGVLIPF